MSGTHKSTVVNWLERADLWTKYPSRVVYVVNDYIGGHDHTPSHKGIIVNEYLGNSTNITDQAPYSLDLAPIDFFLIPKLKWVLSGTHFKTTDAI